MPLTSLSIIPQASSSWLEQWQPLSKAQGRQRDHPPPGAALGAAPLLAGRLELFVFVQAQPAFDRAQRLAKEALRFGDDGGHVPLNRVPCGETDDARASERQRKFPASAEQDHRRG